MALLIDGVDDAGREVGERFADAGAGFEKEWLVGLEDGGNRARHGLLLRAVLELETGVEPAALGEDLRGELRSPARGRGSGGLVVAKSNHESGERRRRRGARQGRRE